MNSSAAELRARVVLVATALALMTAAFVVAKTARDALFFQGRGLYGLPLAYVGIAIASLPMAAAVLALMRFLGPRNARVTAPLIAAAVLAAFVPSARPGGGAGMMALFLFVPLVFGVLFSLSWLLAADLLDRAPRALLASAYGVIGAASMGGGVAGGLLARALSGVCEARQLLWVAAVLLAGSAAVMGSAHRRYPVMRPAPGIAIVTQPGPAEMLRVIRRPYALLLLATGMLASLAGILVEFQFYLAAATSGRGSAEHVRFFANFYVFLNSIALLVQLLVLPRLTRRFGVHGALFVLPAALVGGASVLLASASFVTRSVLRIAEGGLKSSIHRASWEQAYLPLGAAERAVTKLVVDGAGARIAEGIAAMALWFWLHAVVKGGSLHGRDTSWVSWTLLGCTVAWIATTRRLGRSLADRTATADPWYRPDVPLPDT